jgi:cob(I)alamin adenosyltransferase
MSRLYTKDGDDGYTGLLGKGRVPKHHPRPETFGTIDEATAALGVARAACRAPQVASILLQVQRDLCDVMTEVAATPEVAAKFRKLDAERVAWLEAQIDSLASEITVPQSFILPGDTLEGAYLSLARTIVRRAERRVSQLYLEGELENANLLKYLNRLSSLCFALELLENKVAGKDNPTLAEENR